MGSSNSSAAGFGEQGVETLRQFVWQILEKIAWDQSDLNEISQMQSILIAVGQQLHQNQGRQGNDLRAWFEGLSLVD